MPKPSQDNTIKNVKNPIKRAALVGNYCQILRALTQLRYEYIEDYDLILKAIRSLTSKEYSKNIKARDYAEIVQAISTLHKQQKFEYLKFGQSKLSLKKEMEVICLKIPKMMKNMS